MRGVARRASARGALWAGIAALALAMISFAVGRSGGAVVLLVVGGVLIAVAATRLSQLAREVRDGGAGDGSGGSSAGR
jgi:uncharacterized membrane protein